MGASCLLARASSRAFGSFIPPTNITYRQLTHYSAPCLPTSPGLLGRGVMYQLGSRIVAHELRPPRDQFFIVRTQC
ncbi:hypothetical protein GQ53DRAFT_749402 [Thozetella sp. PMI_491]|nr:hypothetical protein GQ53DRAFT_749402 [Thozetella sp. PMI_491]